MSLKSKIVAGCKTIIEVKIDRITMNLSLLYEAAKNETKSTAGDKHETALAMLQIEQAQKQAELDKAKAQLNLLVLANNIEVKNYVTNGSLIQTNQGLVYIGIALGKIIIEEHPIICISNDSPLGKLLIGATLLDKLELNNKEYKIIEILV
jgi:hypothetical protein